MPERSRKAQNRRKDTQYSGATMTTATQYAGLATLLALTTASPSFAQSRTAMENGYPSHYCLPTTVDSSDERRSTAKAGELSAKGGNDGLG